MFRLFGYLFGILFGFVRLCVLLLFAIEADILEVRSPAAGRSGGVPGATQPGQAGYK